MSLLMDALKKAEQAEQAAAAHPASDAGELSLAPLTPTGRTDGSPLRDHEPAGDAADTSLHVAAERSAARNVFSAKTTARPRRALWLALATGAIAALGFGAYLWWQLQSLSTAQRPLPAAPQTPTAVAAPPRDPTAVPSVPPPTPAPMAMPSAPMPPLPLPPASTRPATPAPAVAQVRSSRPSPQAAPNAPDATPRLSRSRLNPSQALERAYDALQAGRLEEAQRDYEQVLRGDARNTDALLGLATIAARRGQAELAQDFYRRALETDPSDPTAQAGLINSRGQADPGLSESRLKGALTSEPESSALHFALGNLYARQSRWSEAQQAYFRAYSGEPENADFIFNLAVSLDQLHQNRLAAQYYQMALNAAAVGTVGEGPYNASFDPAQVKRRLRDLAP